MADTATWYQTKSWSWDIVPVTVLGQTAKRLTIIDPHDDKKQRQRNVDKSTRDTIYHQTRDAALDYLRERLQRLRVQLSAAETKFAATAKDNLVSD